MSRRVRAVDGIVGPGVAPHRDALLHVRRHLPDADRPHDEEGETHGDIGRSSRGRVQDAEEDPEVEEPAAEVARLQQDEHRHSPDHEQRPEVLETSLRQHLAFFAEVAGEKNDQHDLRELAGLKFERPDSDPESRTVHGAADARRERKNQEHDRAEAEEVFVALEPPVVVTEEQERR